MEDVIIVGAGPAGATAACELARRGVGVTLLEMKSRPGRKTCAGGLPPKALGALSAVVGDLIERTCSEIRFRFNGKNTYHLRFKRPVVHMVDRKKLDERLLLTAAEAGARVKRGVRVTGICQGPSNVRIQSSKGVFKAAGLIAASGAKGVASSILGDEGVRNWPAVQVRVWASSALMDRWRERLACDFGIPAGGIGWVFPKGQYLDLGVCACIPGVDLRVSLEKLIQSEGLGGEKRDAPRYHPVPVWDGRRSFRTGSILLVGDAAGLANPLTGAGIRRAVTSARMAAESMMAFLAGGAVRQEDLAAYDRRIRSELLGELKRSRAISKLFYRAPGLFYRAGVINSKVNPWVEQLLSGQKDYKDVFSELLQGKWLY